MRVLIVDDNPHFLEAARNLLQREGMCVVGVASTSVDAVLRVQELHPDVTLVDIDLGEESGLDLAQRLTDLTGGRRSPVILISAYAQQDVADLVEGSPAIGFVSKSFLSERTISELLTRPPDERPDSVQGRRAPARSSGPLPRIGRDCERSQGGP